MFRAHHQGFKRPLTKRIELQILAYESLTLLLYVHTNFRWVCIKLLKNTDRVTMITSNNVRVRLITKLNSRLYNIYAIVITFIQSYNL